MASPSPNWDLVPVRGRYVGTDGTPVTGRVVFTPRSKRLVDAAALRTLIARPIAAVLDNGAFEVMLPASDDLDIVPNGFTYGVVEEFNGGYKYDIDVPLSMASTGVDISLAAPTEANNPGGLTPITRLEYEAFKAEALESFGTTDAVMASTAANTESAFASALAGNVDTRAAQLDATGLTSAQINTWLAGPSPFGGAQKLKRLVGTAVLNAPLVVGSSTYFDTQGAVVQAGANGNMLVLSSQAPQRTVTASTTAGSPTITAVAGTFLPADVGRSLIVPAAGPVTIRAEGPGGGAANNNLTGIITAVATDGSAATIQRPAIVAVTSASVPVHDRCVDTTLDLGLWDRGTYGGIAVDLTVHAILLRRGDRIRLPRLTYRSRFADPVALTGGGKYGVSYADMRDFEAGDQGLTFESSSDGIHGMGPLLNTRVRNVTGTTHDDVCIIGISDYAGYSDVSGPIVDTVFENITARSDARAVLVSGNIRSDYTITGTVVRGVRGETQSPMVRVTGSNDFAGNVSGHCAVPLVRIEDIQGRPRTVSPLLSLNGNIGTVEAVGVHRLNEGKLVQFDSLTKVRSLSLRNFSVTDANTVHVMDPASDVEIGSLVLDGANLVLSGTGASLVYGSAKIDRISLRNYVQTGGRGIDLRRDTAVCVIDLANVESDVPILRPSGGSTQMTVMTSGRVYYSGTTEGAIRMAGGTGTVTLHAGEGFISASGRAISQSAAQAARCIGLAARQPATSLTPQGGDRHFNTETTGPGVGPVVYDTAGSAYKSLGTTGTAGNVTPPATGQSGQPVNAEVLTDLYGRTAAELVGTLPDAGGTAYTGVTGRWKVEGGRLVKGANLDTQAFKVNAPAKGDMAVSFTWRTGTKETASVTERIFTKMVDANTAIRLQRTGQNGASLQLSVVIGGTNRQLGSTVTTAIPANTDPADYAVTITVATSGGTTTASAVVNGVNFPGGALTTDEVNALTDGRGFGVGSTSPNTQIDNLHATVNGTYV